MSLQTADLPRDPESTTPVFLLDTFDWILRHLGLENRYIDMHMYVYQLLYYVNVQLHVYTYIQYMIHCVCMHHVSDMSADMYACVRFHVNLLYNSDMV